MIWLTLWSRHTISTSEIASKLSTWTSTPTGTAGPAGICNSLQGFIKLLYTVVLIWVSFSNSTTAVRADIDQVLHLEPDYLCLYRGCDSFLCQSLCFKQWLLLSFIQIPMKAGSSFPKKMSQSQWSKYYNPNWHYTADCFCLTFLLNRAYTGKHSLNSPDVLSWN